MEQEQSRRSEFAAVFGYPGVARVYRHRPPYPAEVFDILEQISTDRPRRVLDIGAGEGAPASRHCAGSRARPRPLRSPGRTRW